MGFFDIFKQSKKVILESDRRAFLSKTGRITDGTIVDTQVNEAGEEVIYYIYNIHGVDFESSELLSEEQKQNPLRYAPGAKIGVRFDPKNHGNSTLM